MTSSISGVSISYPQPTLQNFSDHTRQTPGQVSGPNCFCIFYSFLVSQAHIQTHFPTSIFSLYQKILFHIRLIVSFVYMQIKSPLPPFHQPPHHQNKNTWGAAIKVYICKLIKAVRGGKTRDTMKHFLTQVLAQPGTH